MAIRPAIDDRMTGHARPTKSSSKHQRKASESSGEDSRPRTRGKARQDSIDDDEKPKPEYASPKDELKAIYLSKAGKPIAVAVLDAIEANLVCIGVEMAAFVEEIRRHSGNDWRNPAGFLRDLSKKFRTKTRSSAAALTAAEAEERVYRCPKCGSRKRGEGALLEGGRVTPCECASPEYIEHLRSRGVLQAAEILEGTLVASSVE
jgi:hypothetical protein